jgi:N-acetylmuramate 1-kinase
VFVHRDYHSRNLMVIPEGNPGIIDFQDALRRPRRLRPRLAAEGLLRLLAARSASRAGCSGPIARASRAHGFAAGAGRERGRVPALVRSSMGVQRHVKVLGIFARLWYRDGKRAAISQDLPLTLEYVRDACRRSTRSSARFARWLEARVVPAFERVNPAAIAAPPRRCDVCTRARDGAPVKRDDPGGRARRADAAADRPPAQAAAAASAACR